ncbi:MAG: nucleotidyl transferase AbiEii/AbiGii toxin family protein [Perlabentimonas sp.]
MSNEVININDVKVIASALKELKEQVVFVGGSILILYINESGAENVRQTMDIDFTLKLNNYKYFSEFQNRLSQLGFQPDPFGHSINSYKYKNIPVDIMLAVDSPLGPCNRWYQKGFSSTQEITIEGETIQIFSAPYFLATKFEAYNNRGKEIKTSHDFEDIIYVINNRDDIVDDIAKTDAEVRQFLKTEIKKLLSNKLIEEILSYHIVPSDFEYRYPLVLEKLKKIAYLRPLNKNR